MMDVPMLDITKASVWFYHNHVVTKEADPDDLFGFDRYLDLSSYYEECVRERSKFTTSIALNKVTSSVQ